MDLSSVFKTEVFRPVVITIVPGVTAIVPYIFVIDSYFPSVRTTAASHETMAIVLIVLAAIAIGLILEDLGSRIEMLIWQKIKDTSGKDDQNWYMYLRTCFKNKPIGHKYTGDIVLRMKFENSFCPALIIFCVGLIWLRCICYIKATVPITVTIIVLIFICVYLVYESWTGSKLLLKLREELLKGVNTLE